MSQKYRTVLAHKDTLYFSGEFEDSEREEHFKRFMNLEETKVLWLKDQDDNWIFFPRGILQESIIKIEKVRVVK